MGTALQWLDEHTGDLLAAYKHLHKIPELGFREYETSAYLADELRKAGFTVRDKIAGTGIVATLQGKEPGPNFALRADMDALPMEEKTGLPYASTHPGMMHACGHDSHSTMVLYAAKAIAATGGIKRGTLTVLLQPSEESLTGARAMIEAGALEGVDQIVGVHVRNNTEALVGQARWGINHAASWRFEAKIHGQAAHAAWIHKGVNVLEAVAAIINGLNAIHCNPNVSYSTKMTRCNTANTAINIIPDLADVAFDVRSGTNEVLAELKEKTMRAIEAGCAGIGATFEINDLGSCPAASFDESLMADAKASIEAVLGEGNALAPVSSPGSEDFHCFGVDLGIPNAFIGIGADMATGGHTSTMCLDLTALPHGAKVLAHLAMAKLG